VVSEGLIAHGRGEMFDYLLGETTLPVSLISERVAAAALSIANRSVISVNGNVAALCPEDVVNLSDIIHATIEVNLFHWNEERASKIKQVLLGNGAKEVLSENPDKSLEGVHHDRGKCHSEGIFSADAVLIPLEDGDRTEALSKMGKVVISIDLNPLSRTSLAASISIVDELTRAIPNIIGFSKEFVGKPDEAKEMLKSYDNVLNLRAVYGSIAARFEKLSE